MISAKLSHNPQKKRVELWEVLSCNKPIIILNCHLFISTNKKILHNSISHVAKTHRNIFIDTWSVLWRYHIDNRYCHSYLFYWYYFCILICFHAHLADFFVLRSRRKLMSNANVYIFLICISRCFKEVCTKSWGFFCCLWRKKSGLSERVQDWWSISHEFFLDIMMNNWDRVENFIRAIH